MKTLMILALALSASAFAMPEFNAQKSSCAEMREALANYGEIKVVSRNFLIKRTYYVYDKVHCRPLDREVAPVFRTRDAFSCEVGRMCESDPCAGAGGYPGNNPYRSCAN